MDNNKYKLVWKGIVDARVYYNYRISEIAKYESGNYINQYGRDDAKTEFEAEVIDLYREHFGDGFVPGRWFYQSAIEFADKYYR